MADKKVDSARALVAGGWRISLVSRCLRVSRSQLHAMARRSKDWQDRQCKRKPDDTDALARIHTVIGDLPTYGYRRVTRPEHVRRHPVLRAPVFSSPGTTFIAPPYRSSRYSVSISCCQSKYIHIGYIASFGFVCAAAPGKPYSALVCQQALPV